MGREVVLSDDSPKAEEIVRMVGPTVRRSTDSKSHFIIAQSFEYTERISGPSSLGTQDVHGKNRIVSADEMRNE